MKNALLTIGMLLTLAAPAAAAEKPVHAAKTAALRQAEKAALAELLSARLKAALQGEAYTLDKTCDQAGCAISIRP